MPFTDSCILQGYLQILDIRLRSVVLTELIYQEKQRTAVHQRQKSKKIQPLVQSLKKITQVRPAMFDPASTCPS